MRNLITREALPGDAAAFITLIKSVVAEYPQVDMPFAPAKHHVTVEDIGDWVVLMIYTVDNSNRTTESLEP